MQENQEILRSENSKNIVFVDDTWILRDDLFEEVVKPFINRDFEKLKNNDGVFMTSQ